MTVIRLFKNLSPSLALTLTIIVITGSSISKAETVCVSLTRRLAVLTQYGNDVYQPELPQLKSGMTAKEIRQENVRASYGNRYVVFLRDGRETVYMTDSLIPSSKGIERFNLDSIVPSTGETAHIAAEIKDKYRLFWKVFRVLQKGMWSYRPTSLIVRRGHASIIIQREDLTDKRGLRFQTLQMHVRYDSTKGAETANQSLESMKVLEENIAKAQQAIKADRDHDFKAYITKNDAFNITISISDRNFNNDNEFFVDALGI